MIRLTEHDLALRAMKESTLQAEVIKLARSLGWGVTLSARKAMLEEAAQYRVEPPALDGLIFHPRYSLGSEPGWPDLTLVRARDRRLVFAELKAEKGVLSARQAEVLELLRCLEDDRPTCSCPCLFCADQPRGHPIHETATDPRVLVAVWRPSDLASGTIAEVLR